MWRNVAGWPLRLGRKGRTAGHSGGGGRWKQREESGGVALLPLASVRTRVAAPGHDRTDRRDKKGGERGRCSPPSVRSARGLRFRALTERFGSMNIDIAHRFRSCKNELNGSVRKLCATRPQGKGPSRWAACVIVAMAAAEGAGKTLTCLRRAGAIAENEDKRKRPAG